jgi:hypothetical protein
MRRYFAVAHATADAVTCLLRTRAATAPARTRYATVAP